VKMSHVSHRTHSDPLPALTVVIPVLNGADLMRGCLEAIANDSYGGPREVVVVDNGSTDGTALVASALGATVLESVAGSVSAIRNAGAARSSSPLIGFVDVDNRVHPGWALAAVGAMADESVSMVGAPYEAPASATWVQTMYDALRRHPSTVEPARWLSAGNIVVRRSDFEAAGGFDESLVACEDVDLCQRLRARGGCILAVPEMRSSHVGDPSTLMALVRGELWRGRNNVRVSLRGPLSARDIPGLLFPVAELSAWIVAPVAVLTGRLAVGIVAAAVLLLAIGVRTVMMVRRAALPLRQWPPAAAVSAVYGLGRALSLVFPGTHRARQQGKRPQAGVL